MKLEQMAERLAGSASSPGEFLVRQGDAMHYLNAAYRKGVEDAMRCLEKNFTMQPVGSKTIADTIRHMLASADTIEQQEARHKADIRAARTEAMEREDAPVTVSEPSRLRCDDMSMRCAAIDSIGRWSFRCELHAGHRGRHQFSGPGTLHP